MPSSSESESLHIFSFHFSFHLVLAVGAALVLASMLPSMGASPAAAREEAAESGATVSSKSRACVGCHRRVTPGLVAAWEASRHAATTPRQGMDRLQLERRISAESVPGELASTAVGCFECHSLRNEEHPDSFDHYGSAIHVVVTPDDCATCHPQERRQFAGSKKAHAVGILKDNPQYHQLVRTVLGVHRRDGEGWRVEDPLLAVEMDACFGCHGTEVGVDGTRSIATSLGEIQVPALTGWPNQGVGRVNPDGSRGACSACHPRHGFSIEVARKPYTCRQCHLDPDVPAFNVYKESQHGNIFESTHHEWTWDAVPWTVGEDFRAPSCATCHNALVVSPQGGVVAERSHDFGARLWVRIFGLPFSHPQPEDGDTSKIRNADGLALPVTLDGEPASEFLISEEEGRKRRRAMVELCASCHGTDWPERFFHKMDATVEATDAMVTAATGLMQEAWGQGLADPANPFDEPLERLWVEQWPFYANSTRYASAMSGPDYAAFKNGWWYLTRNLREMERRLEAEAGDAAPGGGAPAP